MWAPQKNKKSIKKKQLALGRKKKTGAADRSKVSVKGKNNRVVKFVGTTKNNKSIKKKQLALPIGSKVSVKGKNKGVVKFVGTTKFGQVCVVSHTHTHTHTHTLAHI